MTMTMTMTQTSTRDDAQDDKETVDPAETIDAVLSLLYQIQHSTEKMDGEQEIEDALQRGRDERDDDRLCYPAKAGSLQATVDHWNYQTDRMDEQTSEAIDQLRALRAEVSE